MNVIYESQNDNPPKDSVASMSEMSSDSEEEIKIDSDRLQKEDSSSDEDDQSKSSDSEQAASQVDEVMLGRKEIVNEVSVQKVEASEDIDLNHFDTCEGETRLKVKLGEKDSIKLVHSDASRRLFRLTNTKGIFIQLVTQ